MKKNDLFPNSLIFIIAAGVLFVAGSYTLFGINETTGRPRVFSWVSTAPGTIELRNGMHEMTIDSSFGKISVLTNDADEPVAVASFISLLSAQGDAAPLFVFDTVQPEGFIRATLTKKVSEGTGGEGKIYPAGTVAVSYDPSGAIDDFIILVEENILPVGYRQVGAVDTGMDTVASIGTLPRNACDMFSAPVPITSFSVEKNEPRPDDENAQAVTP